MFTEIGRPGCVVAINGPLGKPLACHRPATHAGLAFFEHPRQAVWLVFACGEHANNLIATRTMLERDCSELTRRREAQRRVLEEGVPHQRIKPLAVGSAARTLVLRAQVWASATAADAGNGAGRRSASGAGEGR